MADNPVCDICGKPLALDGHEARYTIADEFDDDGNWTVGRHYSCHQERHGRLKEQVENLSEKVKDTINELRKFGL